MSINGGSENLRAYFSYGNVSSDGITPENDYSQHTLNSKVGFDLFNDHVKVDFTAKYVNQHVANQPAAGWLFNPMTGAYLFPRGEDWNYYKNNYEVYDPTLNANVHNHLNVARVRFDNPIDSQPAGRSPSRSVTATNSADRSSTRSSTASR